MENTDQSSKAKSKADLLASISVGERIAEYEAGSLTNYFVETEQWRQLQSGKVDIVYGPKGAGKSALYSLLTARDGELFDRGIIIVPAENPTGATAFTEITVEPPTSEHEFTGLWKLYFLCLIAQELRDYDIRSKDADELYQNLAQARLLPKKPTLKSILLAARDYSKHITQAESVEGGLGVDPATGMLNGIKGKITFREPSQDLAKAGLISVDTLLEKANSALKEAGMTAWLLLDRLDVAFEQSVELENNALRALFKAYLDMSPLNNISLKVFLRTDIWRRITDGGFREASHITKHLTITWQRRSLLNLIIRRLLTNKSVCDYYNVSTESILSNVNAQEELLAKMLPDQVDTGRNPATFDWMLSRTQDGTKLTAPRELIHLLSSLKEIQLERLELGHEAPSSQLLFDRSAFKEALKTVSEERLTKTLYAEYSDLKSYIEALRQEKTQQNPETLGKIWSMDRNRAHEIAEKLVVVGFFEKRGSKSEPVYWVPFLYRDALEMIQGEAK